MDEELQFHFEQEVGKYEKAGLSREEAQRRARLAFGGAELVKEECREARGVSFIETTVQDLRYGLRALRKSPGFTAVAVLTLALGVGVNTTLFSLFNSVALKSLPVASPDRVFRLVRTLASGSEGDVQYAFSYPEYVHYRENNSVFSGLIAASWPVKVTARIRGEARSGSHALGQPEGIQAQLVSANYFRVLGVSTAIGHTFLPEEDQAQGAQAVAVLSYPFWQRRFNSDPGVLGHVLKLNDVPFVVVGVAGRDFIGTANPPLVPDLWTPLATEVQLLPGEDWLHQAAAYQVQLLGRLSSKAGFRQAQADATVLAQRFQSAQPRPIEDKTLAVTLQHATYFGRTNDVQFRIFIALLMTLAGMVLLVACANLANMALSRCAGRRREIGIRLAIGASRRRLLRQLLTESVLLALVGGAAGLLVSLWATRILWLAIAPIVQSLLRITPSAIQVSPDFRVFGYTLALSLVTGVVFGLSPALRFSRPGLAAAIRDEGAAFGTRVTRSSLRGFLVALEVTAPALLLVMASLLARGLMKSQTSDPGFETQHVIGPLGLWLYDDATQSNTLARRVVERLSELPTVRSVGLVYRAPWSGTWTPPVQVEGTKASPNSLPWQILANYVSPAYFTTLNIPILRGRNFSRYESDRGAPVAIVSERAARQFWPGEDPIGKKIKLDMTFKGDWAEFQVVGVAKDVRTANLSRIDPGYVYLATDAAKLYEYEALIRLQGDEASAVASVRTALEDLDRTKFPRGMWLDTLDHGPLRMQRIIPQAITWFAASLGVLVLLLAMVGVYGVVSYAVSESTHEVGVRMALGASKPDVLYWTLTQKMRPVLVGALAGLTLSIGLSALVRAALVVPGNPDFLFGTNPFDVATFAAAFC